MKDTYKMRQELRAFRMGCYRRMLLSDIAVDAEDYSVQEYTIVCTDAINKAERLLDHLDTYYKDMTSEESADLLLTVFVALNVGFRNYVLFCRAIDKAEQLLPLLPESKLRTHLQVYLNMETGDESMQDEIDKMLSEREVGEQQITQEDKFLMELLAEFVV